VDWKALLVSLPLILGTALVAALPAVRLVVKSSLPWFSRSIEMKGVFFTARFEITEILLTKFLFWFELV